MKKIMVLFLVLGVHVNVFSQLDPYQWRLGISGGFANYYGDLSPFTISSLADYSNFFRLYDYNKNYIPNYSYAVSLEGRLSPTVGLLFAAGKHSISMSDRFVNKDNILQLDAPNFERALNFKTDIRDYGIGLVLKTDNGRFLKENAFIAPYFTLGVGWLNFKVFGDLYDDSDSPYNYDRLENINDGIFETRLDQLSTELPEGYVDNAFYSQLGLGIRFRITRQLELFAQSDFRYTTTDYLDDVSGEYRRQYDSPQQIYAAKPGNNLIDWENPKRGNADGQNDWYIFHSIGIKLSFKPNKTSFRASRVSPGIYKKSGKLAEPQLLDDEDLDSLSSIEKGGPTNNYITFIQLNQPYNRDSSHYFFKMLESDVNILKWEKSLSENENLLASLNFQLDSLEEMREELSVSPIGEENPDLQLPLIQKNIDSLNLQIEEAILNGNKVEEELENSRQNKELFQSAYKLSLKNTNQSDSVKFINEILELPAAVTQALADRGPWYTSEKNSVNNPLLMPSETTSDLTYYGTQSFNSTPSTLGNEPSQDQISALRSDLMQERAKSNYLIRTLGNYSANQNYLQRSYTDEELQNLSERSSIRQQPVYYEESDNLFYPNDRSNVGNNRRQEYILPLIVPRNESRNALPSEENNSAYGSFYQNPGDRYSRARSPLFQRGQGENGPLSLKNMARLNQLSQLGIPYNFSIENQRSSPNLSVPLRERDRTKRDTVFVESEPSNILINNKVDIYFENNQSQPSEQELKKLTPLTSLLKNNSEWTLNISGFADNTGNLRYNLNLINDRIANVKRFFVEKKGISPERISSSSGGLIIRGDGQKSSSMDRKVEVWIQKNN